MNNSINESMPDCCKKDIPQKGFWQGMMYGIIPHAGCIAFIFFSILGVTTATSFLKPFLLNPYFFYLLISLSIVFATLSALLYLRKNCIFSLSGIKRKWKYLLALYGMTILVNLLLFTVVFPYAANVTSKPTVTGAFADAQEAELALKVQIPCPGHAPLITEELKKVVGVIQVQFKFPNLFEVTYDPTKTSEQQLVNMDIFNTYKANIVKTQI